MGESPLTGAWPQLLALGWVLSSMPEEEESGVGDALRKWLLGRWKVEWEKQAPEGQESCGVGRAREGGFSLIPKESLGGVGSLLQGRASSPCSGGGRGGRRGPTKPSGPCTARSWPRADARPWEHGLSGRRCWALEELPEKSV